MKKILSILAAAVMTVSALTGAVTASAATEAAGTCGTGVEWFINSDNVLVVSGEGEITSNSGWNTYAADVNKIVVENGITKPVLPNVFGTCKNVREVYFPDTITTLNRCLSDSMNAVKDIWIFTKELPDDFNGDAGVYPKTGCGIKWHVYKGSTTETSLRNGLKYTDDDFVYITDDDKFPEITNRTPVSIPEVTATSGPCGLKSTYSWDEATKTLTFKGSGTVSIKTNFQTFANKTEIVLMDDSEITSICEAAFGTSSIYSGSATFPKLTKVTFPETLKSIEGYAFRLAPLANKDIEFPEGMERIGEYAFARTKISGDLVLPSTMKSLGQEAFGRTNITSVKIPEDMSVGGTAFSECEDLTEVTIPKGLKYLKNGEGNMSRANKMFMNCVNIEKVIMEDGSTFAEEMFRGCEKVTEVVIKSKIFDKIITGGNTPFPKQSSSYENFMDQITFKTYKGSLTEQNLLAIGILPEKIEYLTDFQALEEAIENAESIETDFHKTVYMNIFLKFVLFNDIMKKKLDK